jgi:guanylate kinase
VTDDSHVEPRLTVVSGPTAVGKGTVVARLAAERPELFVSVSATTRPPRAGERNGVHYWFVSETEFDQMIENDELLEWAVVHGRHRYGTPRAPLLAALSAGRQALLEIDLQGARQVKRNWPAPNPGQANPGQANPGQANPGRGVRFVFLAPPSWAELVRRLVGRGTETQEQRERRLATAQAELAAVSEFDHVVVNGDVSQAVADLVALLGL